MLFPLYQEGDFLTLALNRKLGGLCLCRINLRRVLVYAVNAFVVRLFVRCERIISQFIGVVLNVAGIALRRFKRRFLIGRAIKSLAQVLRGVGVDQSFFTSSRHGNIGHSVIEQLHRFSRIRID